MNHSTLTTSTLPTSAVHHSSKIASKPFYIGKIPDSKAPDFMLNMAALNEHFARMKGVHFVRLSIVCDDPLELYGRITQSLRKVNKLNLHRIPTSGYRLCNVQRTVDRWRLTLNVVCTGAAFAVQVYDALAALRHGGSTFYVSFQTPRKTLVDREFKRYYEEFLNHSHLPTSSVQISMLEPYYWRIHSADWTYCLLQFLTIFDRRLLSIHSSPFNGIEISTRSNIDPDDYFDSDRWQLDGRIRFFQPFGLFYNHLKR